MACLSENAFLGRYYSSKNEAVSARNVKNKDILTYRVSDGFSFNFGTNIPQNSDITKISYPYTLEEKENSTLLYASLGTNLIKEGFDTILLLNASIVSASVYLNGYFVTSLKNVLMESMIRIDEYIKTTNHLYIKFDENKTDRTEQLYSMIIVFLPKSRLTDMYVISSISDSKAVISIDSSLIASDMTAALGGYLMVTVFDDKKNEVAKTNKHIPPFKRNYWQLVRTELEIYNPRLWTIDDPYRYSVVVEYLKSDNTVADIRNIPFGIRDLQLYPFNRHTKTGPSLCLNGVPIKVFGVVVATQDSQLPKKIKAMGLNSVRVIDPINPSFFEQCDKEGLLVMGEVSCEVIPIKDNIFGRRSKQTDPLDVPLELIGEMIARFKNYASIYCWSVGLRKVFGNVVIGEFIRSLDSSRAVNCKGDFDFLLSDFFSADDCDISHIYSIANHSTVLEDGFFSARFRHRNYKNHPFLLCDVDFREMYLKEKIDLIQKNEGFLGFYLSSFETLCDSNTFKDIYTSLISD